MGRGNPSTDKVVAYAGRSGIRQRRAGGPCAPAGRRREQVHAGHAHRCRGQRALPRRGMLGSLREPAHGRRLHAGVHPSGSRSARAGLPPLPRGGPALGPPAEALPLAAGQAARLPRRLRVRRGRRRVLQARALRVEARRGARAGGRQRPGRPCLGEGAPPAEAALPERPRHRGHAPCRRGGTARARVRPAYGRPLRAGTVALARLRRGGGGEGAGHLHIRRRADRAHGARHAGAREGGHGRRAGGHGGGAAGPGDGRARGVRAGSRAARAGRARRGRPLVGHRRVRGGRRGVPARRLAELVGA